MVSRGKVNILDKLVACTAIFAWFYLFHSNRYTGPMHQLKGLAVESLAPALEAAGSASGSGGAGGGRWNWRRRCWCWCWNSWSSSRREQEQQQQEE